jgi:hypothetical protein
VGVLSVKDGATRHDIPLNQTQLRQAKLVYLPQSNRLEMTLEVFSPGGEALRESIIVDLNPQAAQPAKVAAVEISPPKETTHIAVPPQQDDPPMNPVRSFVPPARAVGRPPSDAVLVSDAPPVQSAQALTPQVGVMPAAVAGTPPPPPPPSGLPIQPARSIRPVRPAVPPNVTALLKSPTRIGVRVQIDAQGNVTRAEALTPASGGVSGFLSRSAVEAALLWTFAPARQGSVNIPSEVVLNFVFGEQ